MSFRHPSLALPCNPKRNAGDALGQQGKKGIAGLMVGANPRVLPRVTTVPSGGCPSGGLFCCVETGYILANGRFSGITHRPCEDYP